MSSLERPKATHGVSELVLVNLPTRVTWSTISSIPVISGGAKGSSQCYYSSFFFLPTHPVLCAYSIFRQKLRMFRMFLKKYSWFIVNIYVFLSISRKMIRSNLFFIKIKIQRTHTGYVSVSRTFCPPPPSIYISPKTSPRLPFYLLTYRTHAGMRAFIHASYR